MTSMDPDTTPTPGAGWSVTGQMEQQKLDGTGTFQDGIVVSFVTQFGQQGTVFVPKARFTPELVRAEIVSAARTMDQVHMLADGV
jgi:hypothetical protein